MTPGVPSRSFSLRAFARPAERRAARLTVDEVWPCCETTSESPGRQEIAAGGAAGAAGGHSLTLRAQSHILAEMAALASAQPDRPRTQLPRFGLIFTAWLVPALLSAFD